MTLQTSGAISARDINVEFRRWGTSDYEGRFRLWEDGSTLIPASKPISYRDFYGKSFAKPAQGSGGTTTEKNGYRHHVFTGNGQFCITSPAMGDNSLVDIQHAVIGGGAGAGGGGSNGYDKSECGGGGGGGAYLSGKNLIPNSIACHAITVGSGGAGGVYNGNNTGRGGAGITSTLIIDGPYPPAPGSAYAFASGGGGGGAIIYGGDFGGLSGACGGGGAGKFQASYQTNGGKGTVHFDGGKGSKVGAGGGGTRSAGNGASGTAGGNAGGSLAHPTYGGEFGTGGGGAGTTAGSGYGKGGNGGRMPGGGATSGVVYGSGGGGGGESEKGGSGQKGVVIISIKQ